MPHRPDRQSIGAVRKVLLVDGVRAPIAHNGEAHGEQPRAERLRVEERHERLARRLDGLYAKTTDRDLRGALLAGMVVARDPAIRAKAIARLGTGELDADAIVALIYAGAQKNLGPAGVTLVIVREDLLQRSLDKQATLPTMMNYAVHAGERSLYNTPPTFGVYAVGLVTKWLLSNGGLPAMARLNARKAKVPA